MTERNVIPAATGDEISRKLRSYDRTPFLDLLAIWLDHAPTEADIKALAKKSPEKWVLAMGQIAKTAGYTDKTESTHNININVGQMSDSELEDRLLAASKELRMPILDLQAMPVDEGHARQAVTPTGQGPARQANIPAQGAARKDTPSASPANGGSDPKFGDI